MKSVHKSKKTSPAKNTRQPRASKATIEKIIRKYRLEDTEKQEEEDLAYWASASASTSGKTEMAYSLWEECC